MPRVKSRRSCAEQHPPLRAQSGYAALHRRTRPALSRHPVSRPMLRGGTSKETLAAALKSFSQRSRGGV